MDMGARRRAHRMSWGPQTEERTSPTDRPSPSGDRNSADDSLPSPVPIFDAYPRRDKSTIGIQRAIHGAESVRQLICAFG